MSTEKFATRLGKALDRRGFVGKLGAAAVGVAAGLLGSPQDARASVGGCSHNPVLCCCLCNNVPPGTTCSGPIYCTWSWVCCNAASSFRQYRCIEGYGHAVACNPPSGQCNQYIECSGILATGARC